MDAPVKGELGKYRLIAEIARGGMGIVYLALMPGPGGFYKTLVVKELKPDYAHDPSFLAMFLDEARVAAKLHHPNIVQVYEVDHVADRYFIAMEYLEGCTMRRALKLLRTDFPVGMVLAALIEVLRGLHHAHQLADEAGESMHLVHRDMSPHNIFLTFDGQAKIVDFGIVKTRDSSHTEVGVFKGKVAYMPPEQAMPDVTVDRRADIYAVGVILFEALTGQRLWANMQEVHILASLMKGDIPSIEKVKPSVPAELKRICSRAMARDRDDRYATADEFREDLESYYEQARLSVTMRDVGSLLARSLETERAKMKTLVDRKIAQLKETGNVPKVSVLPPPPSAPQLAADQSGSISGFYEERDPALEKPKLASLVSETETSALGETFRKSRLRSFMPQLVVGASILLAFALFLVFFGPTQDAPAPPQPVSAASAPILTGPSPSPDTVSIEVRVTPPDATVEIDGTSLQGGGPYTVRYKRGQDKHVARAMQDGYIAKVQEFTADRDMLLDMSLAPIPPPPVTLRTSTRPSSQSTHVSATSRESATSQPQPVSTPPTTQPPSHSTTAPGPTVRPIETSSPYGGQ